MATFEDRLAATRKEKDLTEEQAAGQIGISTQQYKDFECGVVDATFLDRFGLFVGLGCSGDEARTIANEPDSGTLEEFLNAHESTEPQPPFVQISGGIIEIFDRGRAGGAYEIAAERITSPEIVMRWIEHLSGKTWITKKHLREFVRVCSDHLGTSLHPI